MAFYEKFYQSTAATAVFVHIVRYDIQLVLFMQKNRHSANNNTLIPIDDSLLPTDDTFFLSPIAIFRMTFPPSMHKQFRAILFDIQFGDSSRVRILVNPYTLE